MHTRHRPSASPLRNMALAAFACTVLLTQAAQASDTRVFVERLLPSTGFNSDCDTPIFRAPAPLPENAHFDFIGLHDPDAPADEPTRDAIQLIPSDCSENLDRDIATTSNAAFRAANGGFPDADPRLKNLRTNEVPKAAMPDGTRLFLPPEGATPPPFPPTNSAPNTPLTLGEFRDVSGKMVLKCRADGSARVRLKVRGYRPNSLLTVWAVWLATAPGTPGPGVVPLPFGGVPNVLPIGKKGRGNFVRELSYCPRDIQPNGDQLMVLDIAEHLDGATYGALPDVPLAASEFMLDPADPSTRFSSVIGAGIVTVNRGIINMTLEEHED